MANKLMQGDCSLCVVDRAPAACCSHPSDRGGSPPAPAFHKLLTLVKVVSDVGVLAGDGLVVGQRHVYGLALAGPAQRHLILAHDELQAAGVAKKLGKATPRQSGVVWLHRHGWRAQM